MQKIHFILLILILGSGIQTSAQGDLLITPIRVVFEGNKQKEALNLVNVGKDTCTYSISFIHYNMNVDGSFVRIENPDSGQWFAAPYLRIFPRKVMLAPGEPQVIMLQLGRKPDMPSGEYRSHLYFRAEKNNNPLGTRDSDIDSTQLSVQLIPVYGISIPVIIRNGEANVKTSLSNLKLDIRQDSYQTLALTINRTGNFSVYGDIKVEYLPMQGKSFEIGLLKGVGVYTNINKRNIVVKLNNTSAIPLTTGILKVQYINNSGSKTAIYAEGEVEIK